MPGGNKGYSSIPENDLMITQTFSNPPAISNSIQSRIIAALSSFSNVFSAASRVSKEWAEHVFVLLTVYPQSFNRHFSFLSFIPLFALYTNMTFQFMKFISKNAYIMIAVGEGGVSNCSS